ncbi:MAG: NAD(P)H-dependent glycerol-3-phosphate dehydrogenase [Ruminococcaceae bacterium]|nr:NAD(P)H-dependent glycerol-3-phosphate dehydrogenase [Oscillospiraceae bacterium]
MTITVIGCGRWGTFIAYYLDTLGHTITLYGRKGSETFQRLLETRNNDLVTLSDRICLTDELSAVEEADIVLISIGSQGLRSLCQESPLQALRDKTIVLCMKGLEIGTGCRLTEVVAQSLHPSNTAAVWIGPGHVQEFVAGVPNCMVIDCHNEAVKHRLVEAFSGPLIRFYYGSDLIGNEVGAAAKNVIGIAAGMLDGYHLSSLKGALMSRGTREISRLICAMGGNELSAYGLCHLGDYEATVFSPYSHNRRFGEAFVKGEPFEALAEGYYTVKALVLLAETYQVELPICRAVYDVLYEKAAPQTALRTLLDRSLKQEF